MTHLRPALVLTAFFLALTGLAFPGVIWAIGQLVLPHQANGSLVADARGNAVGSALLGQTFTRLGYFHSRPSAAGYGYDAANSGGTNLGPTNAKLVSDLRELARAYREENGLSPGALLPADAAARSASGLDPHISLANAELQAARVARARSLSTERVRELVSTHTEGRDLGLLGEPRVNVLSLNLALDRLK